MFGAPIDIFQIQRKMNNVYTEGQSVIPPILIAAFQFLNRYALNITGIFRISGKKAEITTMVQQFNAGIIYDSILTTGVDPDDQEFFMKYVRC